METEPNQNISAKIEAFRRSVTPDLYSPESFISFRAIESRLAENAHELDLLNKLPPQQFVEPEKLADLLLRHAGLYSVLCRLFLITGPINFEDGQSLPPPNSPPTNHESALSAADLLNALGLRYLVERTSDWTAPLLIAEIAGDAPRRRIRAIGRQERRVRDVVSAAIHKAEARIANDLRLVPPFALPRSAQRVAKYVVAADGRPAIAVAATFQARSGGRQQRDLEVTYPNLQSTLAAEGMSLVLIADGLAMRKTPDRVLAELFMGVADCMTLKQAASGLLEETIVRLVQGSPIVSRDQRAIDRLIASSLSEARRVSADELPMKEDDARLALASYATAHPNHALELAPGGLFLDWKRKDAVELGRGLEQNFVPSAALELLAELLGSQVECQGETDANSHSALLRLLDDPILPPISLAVISQEAPSATLVREVSRRAMQQAPDARLATLIVPESMSLSLVAEIRRIQAHLPVAVVVLDVGDLVRFAQGSNYPRDDYVHAILEQSDLTKLSPFVVRGVTPERIFFGRETEEATLLSTLPTNSVALLGGRRIGKTSLILHAERRLSEAGFLTRFGDCQTVRDWADFGSMARRRWGVALPDDFKPHHLFDLVHALKHDSDQALVIMLDEIDQLLDWDQGHSEDDVPEAFFRACRSISQQGLAQFVFSGERTIARRMWDAQSPHWNFCRPVMLQQLTRSAAAGLIEEPLRSLQIPISEAETFVEQCLIRTDRHPELLQYLGDSLIKHLNNKSRDDLNLGIEDVEIITEQYEYAEQYLSTYWGQSTEMEKILSLLISANNSTLAELETKLQEFGVAAKDNDVVDSLRMLDLYGIVHQGETGYELKAAWFPSALAYFGGVEASIDRLIEDAA